MISLYMLNILKSNPHVFVGKICRWLFSLSCYSCIDILLNDVLIYRSCGLKETEENFKQLCCTCGKSKVFAFSFFGHLVFYILMVFLLLIN